MKLKVNNLAKFPENFEYKYGSISELDEYDFENLQKLGVDEIWYFYAVGIYEGNGQILMRKNNLFDIHDAGHCSCYGATDKISFNGKTFEELEKSISKEYYREVKELFDLARNSA